MGGLGLAAAAAATRVPATFAAATDTEGVSRGQAERANSAGAATGGPPLALGSRRVIWSAAVTSSVFALTFDDGPDPEFTPAVLDILAKRNVKATFNMMGYNVEHHAALAREVVAHGHEVGNHTWTHLDLAFEDERSTYEQLSRGKQLITEVTGQTPFFFRPPRGELTGSAMKAAASLGHDVLMYTMLGDVDGVEQPEMVRSYVVANLKPGYIIDFHDGIGRGTFDRNSAGSRGTAARRHAEIAALPSILDTVMDKGLLPVTASQLLAHEAAGTAAVI